MSQKFSKSGSIFIKKNKAQKLIKEVQTKQKFYYAVQENKIATAYNMMAIAEDLLETDAGIELHRQWNKNVSQANKYAAEGKVDGVYKVLKPYMKIESKYTSLATIFGCCYIVQLGNALQNNVSQATLEKGIKIIYLVLGNKIR